MDTLDPNKLFYCDKPDNLVMISSEEINTIWEKAFNSVKVKAFKHEDSGENNQIISIYNKYYEQMNEFYAELGIKNTPGQVGMCKMAPASKNFSSLEGGLHLRWF